MPLATLRRWDASGAVHGFSYNLRDQAAGYVPPNLGDGQPRTESQEYNADGDMISEVLGDGTQFSATYNSADQLTKLEASDGSVVDIEYQSGGLRQVTSISETGRRSTVNVDRVLQRWSRHP